MYDLEGERLQELHKALLSAYPKREHLSQMVRIRLNVNLDSITRDKDQSTTIFDLIEWAERTGRIDELIRGAHEHNSGNPRLRALAQNQRPDGSSGASPASDDRTTSPRTYWAWAAGAAALLLVTFGVLNTAGFRIDIGSPSVAEQQISTAANPDIATPAPGAPTSAAAETPTLSQVPSAAPLSADELFAQAEEFRRQENWTESIAAFEQAIDKGYARAWVAYLMLGDVSVNLAGDLREMPDERTATLEKSLDAYLKAESLGGEQIDGDNHRKLCLNRAGVRAELGQIEETVRDYECAITYMGDPNPGIFYQYGIALARAERWDDAIAAFQNAIDAGADSALQAKSYHQMAQAESKKPDADTSKIIEYLTQSIDADGTFLPSYASLGATFQQLGDAEAACKAYLAYMEQAGPDTPTEFVEGQMRNLNCSS